MVQEVRPSRRTLREYVVPSGPLQRLHPTEVATAWPFRSRNCAAHTPRLSVIASTIHHPRSLCSRLCCDEARRGVTQHLYG